MAILVVVKIPYKRVSYKGDVYNSYAYRCVCSECREYIASPSNGNVYKHCYNCGAKFNEEVSAKSIRKAKAMAIYG